MGLTKKGSGVLGGLKRSKGRKWFTGARTPPGCFFYLCPLVTDVPRLVCFLTPAITHPQPPLQPASTVCDPLEPPSALTSTLFSPILVNPRESLRILSSESSSALVALPSATFYNAPPPPPPVSIHLLP